MIDIQENIPLKNHTTFKIGGPARYFTIAQSIDDIRSALDFANKNNIDFFILAGGSNLIVSDVGYNGLVIKLNFSGVEFKLESVSVGSGILVNLLVTDSVSRGLSGLEWAGGLPGTIGGGIRGNAGAFSGEMKDVVSSVQSITSTGVIKERNNLECLFGYRTSIFKHNKEIIIRADLKFKKGNTIELQKIAEEHRTYRQIHHPMEFPNTGSIFKNVPVQDINPKYLPNFEEAKKIDPFPVIPTAKILSDAGLKGFKIGDAQISEKHPNYIVNLGQAKATDVVSVIQNAIAVVMDKFEIQLQVEPQLLGFEVRYPWESK